MMEWGGDGKKTDGKRAFDGWPRFSSVWCGKAYMPASALAACVRESVSP